MVPPCSDQVSRVWPYSGSCAAVQVFIYVTLTLFGGPSHALRLTIPVLKAVLTPERFLSRFALFRFRSPLLTESHVDVSSSPYLDVSVQAVPSVHLWIQCTVTVYEHRRVAPFRNPWIKGCLLLPKAYRSLPRLSSAPSAKAFSLRPF